MRLENEDVYFIYTEKYEEDIERLLIENKGDSEKEVCFELTKACEGVDRTKKEKEDVDVRFNDQKQDVKTGKLKQDDDGVHRMNVDINDPGAAARLAEQIKQQIGQGAMGGEGYDDDDDDDDEEEDDSDDDEKGETQSSEKKTEL